MGGLNIAFISTGGKPSGRFISCKFEARACYGPKLFVVRRTCKIVCSQLAFYRKVYGKCIFSPFQRVIHKTYETIKFPPVALQLSEAINSHAN
jgi:hypothetical protein